MHRKPLDSHRQSAGAFSFELKKKIISLVSLLIIIALGLFLSWEFYVSKAPVYRENIVDSWETPAGEFTAAGPELTGISVSADMDTDDIPSRVQVVVEDAAGKEMYRQTLDTDSWSGFSFSKTVKLKKPVRLQEGAGYRIHAEQKGKYSFILQVGRGSLLPWFLAVSAVCMALGVLVWEFLSVKSGQSEEYQKANVTADHKEKESGAGSRGKRNGNAASVSAGDEEPQRDSVRLAVFFLLAALLLGILTNLVCKPLGVPDEDWHFGGAYHIANVLLGKGGADGQKLTVYSSGFVRSMPEGESYAQGTYRFYNNWAYGNAAVESQDSPFQSQFVYVIYEYLPSGLGVLLARVMGMPYQGIYLMGRLFYLLFYIGVCLLAMRVCPKMRYAVAAVGLLPSSIYLAASFSYDGWSLSLSMLFAALCARLAEDPKGVRLKDAAAGILILLLFVPIKVLYAVLALLILMIPWRQWKQKKLIFGIAAAGIAAAAVVGRNRIQEMLRVVTTDVTDPRGLDQGLSGEPYTIGWCLRHIGYVFEVMFKTFVDTLDDILSRIAVGEFHSSAVPWILRIGVLILLLAVFYYGMEGDGRNKRTRIIAGATFVIGCLALYAAFLFTYSYRPEKGIGVISGLQGRYYLPFVILIPLFMQHPVKAGRDRKEKKAFSGNRIEPATVLESRDEAIRAGGRSEEESGDPAGNRCLAASGTRSRRVEILLGLFVLLHMASLVCKMSGMSAGL